MFVIPNSSIGYLKHWFLSNLNELIAMVISIQNKKIKKKKGKKEEAMVITSK